MSVSLTFSARAFRRAEVLFDAREDVPPGPAGSLGATGEAGLERKLAGHFGVTFP